MKRKIIDLTSAEHSEVSYEDGIASAGETDDMLTKGESAPENIGIITLKYAIAKKCVATVKLLSKCKMDFNATDEFGRTPLFWAIDVESVRIMQILLKKGVSVNVRDNEGHTPLTHALRHRRKNIVKIAKFLLRFGADVSVKVDGKSTAMIALMTPGGYKVLKVLLNFGVSIDEVDKNGMFALDYFKGKQKREFVVLAHTLRTQNIEITLKNRSVYNFVNRAIMSELRRRVVGIDIYDTDSHDRNLIHYCVRNSERPLYFEQYVLAGLNLNAGSRSGMAPLMLSILLNRHLWTSALLSSGVEVNIVDNTGASALFYALWCCNWVACKELCKKGANIYQRDKHGFSVVSFLPFPEAFLSIIDYLSSGHQVGPNEQDWRFYASYSCVD